MNSITLFTSCYIVLHYKYTAWEWEGGERVRLWVLGSAQRGMESCMHSDQHTLSNHSDQHTLSNHRSGWPAEK